MYVDELWAGAPAVGGTLLYCCFPNTWVDVNRSESDMDPAVVDGEWPKELEAHGAHARRSRADQDEVALRRTVPGAQAHRGGDRGAPALAGTARTMRSSKRLVDALYGRFGVLRQISCHCMSAVGAPTHPDAGKPRADFCVSDLKGRTASREAMALVVDTLKSYGYSVSVNDPYVGNELIGRHGDSRARRRLDPGRDQQEALHGHEDFPQDAGLRRSSRRISTGCSPSSSRTLSRAIRQ